MFILAGGQQLESTDSPETVTEKGCFLDVLELKEHGQFIRHISCSKTMTENVNFLNSHREETLTE